MMPPLKIVLVMIEPPLPFGNAAARWYYVLLRGLVQRGHRVTAFAACSGSTDAVRAAEIFPASDYDLRCFTHPEHRGLFAKLESFRQPFSYVFAPELRRELKRELQRGYDVLHLEMHWSGWLGLAHADRSLLNIHYLYGIDWNDGRKLSGEEARYLQAERRLLTHYQFIRTLTPRLSTQVARINPGAEVATVPLAIESALYEFAPPEPAGDGPVVGLIGSFNWGPTLSAGVRLLTRLWPRIRERVPNARLLLAGREARQAMKEFLAEPGVEIHENVEDIIPLLRRMNVMLYAPGRGSGMKVKVLESMALGVPVVTTSEGVEGLTAVDGVHAGVSDDDAGLIERTVALLNELERAARQALSARLLIEEECDPDAALDGIDSIYQRIVSR
jgi:glycosyltransferase involved in cell wall biosynthesis